MSLATLAVPAARTLPMSGIRGRGRPKVDADPVERSRHVRAACLYLSGYCSTEEVCGAFAITSRTLRDWVKLARGYPEGESLRGMRRAR